MPSVSNNANPNSKQPANLELLNPLGCRARWAKEIDVDWSIGHGAEHGSLGSDCLGDRSARRSWQLIRCRCRHRLSVCFQHLFRNRMAWNDVSIVLSFCQKDGASLTKNIILSDGYTPLKSSHSKSEPQPRVLALLPVSTIRMIPKPTLFHKLIVFFSDWVFNFLIVLITPVCFQHIGWQTCKHAT